MSMSWPVPTMLAIDSVVLDKCLSYNDIFAIVDARRLVLGDQVGRRGRVVGRVALERLREKVASDALEIRAYLSPPITSALR